MDAEHIAPEESLIMPKLNAPQALLATTHRIAALAAELERTTAIRAQLIKRLDPEQVQPDADALRNSLDQARASLTRLSTAFGLVAERREVKRVVIDGDELARLMPEKLVEAYSLLHYEVFEGQSVKSAPIDPSTGKAVRGRTRSDQVETRGGAVQKSKYSQSTRDPIRDHRMYESKRKIDKRLRKLAGEIYALLNDAPDDTTPLPRCSSCHRFGNDGDRYCSSCGCAVSLPCIPRG